MRDALITEQPELADSRIVPGNFGSNALAIGYGKERPAAAAVVKAFTQAVITCGFVSRAIERAGISGALASPP